MPLHGYGPDGKDGPQQVHRAGRIASIIGRAARAAGNHLAGRMLPVLLTMPRLKYRIQSLVCR